jgi:murein DD-endopeptidase MepM/ murein hydrolase activator NlpD
VTLRRKTALALLFGAAIASLVPASAPAAGKPFGSRVLMVGSKGKDVRALQRSLTTLGQSPPVDGYFGTTTKASVKKLERQEAWKVDGKVTKKDARRIKTLVSKRSAKLPSMFFLGGLTQPTATVTVSRPGSVSLNVVDTSSGLGVVSVPLTFTDAGSQTVPWTGVTAVTGLWAPDATYRFTISDEGNTGAFVSGQTKPFGLRRHYFPVPGNHSYGGAGSRFGASRSGHTHQGQDLSARCGEKLYATEAGTVTTKAYQASGAGYYLVIKGTYTGTSHVYMHMQKPSWAEEGTTLYPGQQIGKVGTTGSSTGCHLHFERWSAPGWYEGGAPYDPYDELQAWDAYS